MPDPSEHSENSSPPSLGVAPDVQPQPVLLHMPVDVRSASLALLALIASLVALRWAKDIVIPILLGIMVSYALTPIVNQMQRWRIPRPAGASFLLVAILLAAGWGARSLSDQVNDLVDTLPQVTQRIRQLSRGEPGTVSNIKKVQQAAAELEAAANEVQMPASAAGSTASHPAPKAVSEARISNQPAVRQQASGSPAQGTATAAGTPTTIDVRGYLLSGTIGALALLSQIAVVLFIALFSMASGNSFRRKMVKLAGPKLSRKKITIQTLDEITDQIQRYLLVQLAVSVCVGIATWLAFYAIGLQQSAVWGVVAGVTNLVPYVGALVVGVGSAVVGLVQFGTPGMAILVGASSFAIHALIGNLLTPWWMGRASRLSPIAVFIAVLVFGWLWGVGGLLLGVPILLVVKSVCDRIEGLKPVGEFLGA